MYFLYPEAVSFVVLIFLETETGFVFTKDMNDEIVERFHRKVLGTKNTAHLTANSGFFIQNIATQKIYLYRT